MKKLLLTFFTIILFANIKLSAQDAHFSQYFNKPLLLNPALAGNGIEYIRLTAIYRNQWAGMGDPFTTQGFSVDKVVNRVGIGAMITRNAGGDGAIATLNLVGNLAYHFKFGYEKDNTISAGVQLGIVNKSFDPSKLTFDSQYNPDQGYDPSQGNGEVFTNTSITRPDLNAGFIWQRGWMKKDIMFKPFLGVSFAHLNRPVETFIVDDVRVDIKNSFYGGAGFMLNDKTELKPSVLYISQGTFKETVFGTNLNYQLDSKNQLQLGVHHRVNDAVIAYAGYQMNQLYVGTSYDFNTGELSKTGKGTNAFEISIAYSPRPKKQKTPDKPKATPPKKTVFNKKVPSLKIKTIPHETEQTLATKPATNNVSYIVVPANETAILNNVENPVTSKTGVVTQAKQETQIPRANEKVTQINSVTSTTVPVNDSKITPATKVLVTSEIKIPNEVVDPVNSVKQTEIPNAVSEIIPVTKTPITADIKIPDEVIEPVTIIPVKPKTDLTKTIVAPDTKTPESILINKPIINSVPVIPAEKVDAAPQINVTPVTAVIETVITTKPEVKVIHDSDKDGINDDEDRCPFIKGGKNTNGCPDSDNDGLIDMSDDCPLESGPATNKGCPDPNVPKPENNQELVRTFEHILFTKGSVKMTTDDIYDIVERAVDMLYADKTLTVLLSGHTDSEGDETFNMNLSQNRTEIVKAYLAKQGIPENRIQTVAYGETMPLSNNLFEETMKQNRRVELNILRKK